MCWSDCGDSDQGLKHRSIRLRRGRLNRLVGTRASLVAQWLALIRSLQDASVEEFGALYCCQLLV